VTAAYASSVKVPWFIDTAAVGAGVPGSSAGVTGIVTLASNRTDTLVCAISYYNAGGDLLGPFAPDNTFTISPLSSLAFRPCVDDPGTAPGGQEGAQGVAVPNRPRSPDTSTVIPGTTVIDKKKNGSIVIQWVGGDADVQGQVAYFQTAGTGQTMSYAHLLPPGV